MPDSEPLTRIDILLPTYNGEKYLKPLLDSIALQSFKEFRLIVRDDASFDRSQSILLEHPMILQGNGVVHVNEVNVGVVENINRLLNDSSAPYLMFADQDDVWFEYKIQKSLQKIREIEAELGSETPVLVFTDAFVGNEHLETQPVSLLARNGYFDYGTPENAISFKNLMVQNIASGCTMIVNRALKNLAMPIPKGAIMHDWWFMLVASALGKVECLMDRTMLYRIHSSNTVGLRVESFWKNVILLLKSPEESRLRVRKTYYQADFFYKSYSRKLDDDAKELLKIYRSLLSLAIVQRWRVLVYYQFRKSSFSKTVGLYLFS